MKLGLATPDDIEAERALAELSAVRESSDVAPARRVRRWHPLGQRSSKEAGAKRPARPALALGQA